MTSSTEPPRTAHNPEPASYTSHVVQAGKVKLHYADYGAAGKPPMLCIHGGAANSHWFDYVAPGFNKDHHVRSLDLRGHGDSEHVSPPDYLYATYAADVNKAVEALDLRDFVLMGHSMGGTVSLVYLTSFPGRVGKFIMIDSTVNLSPERIALLRDVGSRPGRDYDSRDEMVSRYRLRPGESLAPPETVRYIASHSIKATPEGKWRYKFDRDVYATREAFDGMPLWEQVKVPVLIVRGDRSTRITPEIFAMIKQRCPQAELVTVSSSDHHVTLDNPAGFIEQVKPWLSKAS